MTKTTTLSRGFLWNLAGQGFPLAVAVVCIPLLVRHLGVDRFGLLTFIWMTVGYSGLLDLGIGRALTQGIAERLGNGQQDEIPTFIQTGLIALLLFSAVIALGVLAFRGTIIHVSLKIPAAMSGEADTAMALLAIAIPLVIMGTALRGVIEAYQHFKPLSLIKASIGTLLYALPLLATLKTKSIPAIVIMLILTRALESALYLAISIKLNPATRSRPSVKRKHLQSIFRFGIWSTINNLIGSLMALAYVDKFIIGSQLGTSFLAYYSVPFDMIVRALIIPAALMTVVFPIFSSLGMQSREEAMELASKASRLIIFFTAPVFLTTIILAKPILFYWLGLAFAQQSAINLQFFSIGIFTTSIAYVPFAFIQAMGRPDLTAKRHLLEIPFYLLASFWAIHRFGPRGGAMAWVLWNLVDLWLIYRIMYHITGAPRAENMRSRWPVIGLFIIAFYIGQKDFIWLIIGLLVSIPASIAWGWLRILNVDDKKIIYKPFSDMILHIKNMLQNT